MRAARKFYRKADQVALAGYHGNFYEEIAALSAGCRSS